MKNKIIKLMCVFSVFTSLINQVYAENVKNVCDVSWDAKVKGVTVGKNEDKLIINNNKIQEITSVFTPNSALKIFGIKAIKRKVIFNIDGKILTREEQSIDGKSNKIVWKKSDKETYQKFDGNDLTKETSIGIEQKTIDSTVFPYLAFLGLLNKEESSPAFVIGKNSTYQANIKRQEKNGKDILIFETDKNNGQVFLDVDRKPNYFTFSQDGQTLEAYRTNWSCSND